MIKLEDSVAEEEKSVENWLEWIEDYCFVGLAWAVAAVVLVVATRSMSLSWVGTTTAAAMFVDCCLTLTLGVLNR